MYLGQSHMFPKWLESWTQKCSGRWSLCVYCSTAQDFWLAAVILENSLFCSRTIATPTWFLLISQWVTGCCWNRDNLAGSNGNEHSRAGSSSILSVNLRLQQSYGRLHTLPIMDCFANCKLFSFSRKKSESIRWPLLTAVFHTIWPFCSAVLRMRKWSKDWQLVDLLRKVKW